jgi:hypothetical protein
MVPRFPHTNAPLLLVVHRVAARAALESHVSTASVPLRVDHRRNHTPRGQGGASGIVTGLAQEIDVRFA